MGRLPLVDFRILRGQGVGRDPQCASASVGIEALEVVHKLPCLIATHAGDHLTGDGLPGEIVCQVKNGAACLRGGEFGGGDLGVGHGGVRLVWDNPTGSGGQNATSWSRSHCGTRAAPSIT